MLIEVGSKAVAPDQAFALILCLGSDGKAGI